MTAGMFFVVALIGYLIGSIPTGVMIGRLFTRSDIRTVGSGKTGMTNVMRAAGKKAAALALLLDMTKGALAVIFAGLIFHNEALFPGASVWVVDGARILAALMAIVGHSWSVFLKFQGGRGVATFIGALVALYWPAAIVGGAIMIIVGLISKYMSLGSITGAVAAYVMLIVLFMVSESSVEFLLYTIFTMFGSVFIFFMHRDNAKRLVNGTERKLGEKVSTEPTASTGKIIK